ncbi:hypothetical protein ACE2AJ_01105 [Aquihabitans daechungensis]|uniref:hypothetical protein n=1 Tax=Aquihabitans daechungensis TaxID=1052257 RepID=UPI003B9FFF41
MERLDRRHDLDRDARSGHAASVLISSLGLVALHRRVHVAADHVRDGFQPVEPPELRIHEEDVLGAGAPQGLDALGPVALEPGSAVEHEDFFGGHEPDARRRGARPFRMWTAENLMSVDGAAPQLTINVVEFRGDKVAREIVSITDRFEAAPQRAPFAERFDVP